MKKTASDSAAVKNHKLQTIFIDHLRQALLKIYQIEWIKKLAITFLERFPAIQKYLLALMYKKKTYTGHPYYNNDAIINSAYLPETARVIYIDLLDNYQKTP